MAELGEATRNAAQESNSGAVDLEVAFEEAGTTERAGLFVDDKVHLSRAGQELVARSVFGALAEAVKSEGSRN